MKVKGHGIAAGELPALERSASKCWSHTFEKRGMLGISPPIFWIFRQILG